MIPKKKAKQLIKKHLNIYDVESVAIPMALISVEFAKEFITGDLSEQFDKFLYLQDIKEEIEIFYNKYKNQ